MWNNDIIDMIRPLAVPTIKAGMATGSNFSSIATLTGLFFSGYFNYNYDGVSSSGNLFGFKHAKQWFQPLSNPLVGGGEMEAFAPDIAPDYPQGDFFQTTFSWFMSLTFGVAYPNHMVCCYSSQENEVCSAQLEHPILNPSCAPLAIPR